jgi:hypothetical protein
MASSFALRTSVWRVDEVPVGPRGRRVSVSRYMFFAKVLVNAESRVLVAVVVAESSEMSFTDMMFRFLSISASLLLGVTTPLVACLRVVQSAFGESGCCGRRIGITTPMNVDFRGIAPAAT